MRPALSSTMQEIVLFASLFAGGPDRWKNHEIDLGGRHAFLALRIHRLDPVKAADLARTRPKACYERREPAKPDRRSRPPLADAALEQDLMLSPRWVVAKDFGNLGAELDPIKYIHETPRGRGRNSDR